MHISLQYLKENLKDEDDFLPADKRQKFFQIDTIILGLCSMYKLPNITNYAISLQCLKKEVSDENDFLHADKHESFRQIDTMILMGIVKHSQSSHNSKFAMSLQYFKEEVKDEVDFLNADKHHRLLLANFNTPGNSTQSIFTISQKRS